MTVNDHNAASRFARVRGRLADRSGQALVEFALVVPLILVIVLGIVDFGRAYNYKNDVTSLANQAARLAEVNACSQCTSGQMIDEYIESTADSNELANGGGQISSPVEITFCFPTPGTGKTGESLLTTATATYNWLPFLGIQATSTLKSTVTVRIAQDYKSPFAYTASACP
jgi:Flp pilus assembly protein TadG